MKQPKTVSIMDIPFTNSTREELLNDKLIPAVRRGEKCFVVTANPEIVMKTREDVSYKNAVKAADYIVPDGAGILVAAKHQNEPLQERIPGYELMLDLLASGNQHQWSCYFLGASEEVNQKAVDEIQHKFPDIKIAGRQHGFFEMNSTEIPTAIRQAAPDMVFVALGLPRQEQWIASHFDEFSKGLFMGVGGSFDVLAGEVKRAPKIWIKWNLEWMYRLIKQPMRIKRIIKVFEFIIRIYLKK
ncbi:WecB/TagA/CpsF family glycosyltransferase [Virgibacillus sp. W0181]|uniref:WecB/TagA/CpsF family glycosyltransferase n=1 Tax=Virgibacillus sp. W0181 TaxID=3391581 RepID=UPI003F47718F